MEGALTISKQLPARPSMQYDQLRQLGIQHIQQLAGKLWTDYNTHDPGITMLEMLCYAITDLGYRVNFDIRDLLTQDPDNPTVKDLRNFYTACEILPNCPLTINDYRKLMMDVEVVEGETVYSNGTPIEQKIYSGVKNAWIKCVKDAGEKEIFIDRKNSLLSLAPVPHAVEQEHYFVKTLYDVLLEFDKNDKYGDLNENKLSGVYELQEADFFTLSDPDKAAPILGTQLLVDIEFPRWDEPDLNWASIDAVRSRLSNEQIDISLLTNPPGYEWTFSWNNTDGFTVQGKEGNSNAADDVDTDVEQQIATKLNAFLNTMISTYQAKVGKIEEVIRAVKERLHANRNLCDDFFRFRALKIEEIILCSDIEIRADADVEAVEAVILLTISDFLAPKVYFYTLEEMRNKCRASHRYPVASINARRRIFTISEVLVEDLNTDDLITVEGIPAAGVYTAKCIGPNEETNGYVDIQVREEILSEEWTEEAVLFKGVEEENCPTIDEIFEGPKLRHGFIDDAELARADRRKYIRVSDLIRIIMDVEGVVAIRNIQLANRPLDNDSGIESKSVRWCLELAMEEDYVPRLHLEDSILTFYKDQIPFIGKRSEVYERLNALEDDQRPQKIRYPRMDLPVPPGEFQDLENYTSIQEHFPQFYGLGEEGIPGLSALSTEQRQRRESATNQHKAFLLFFDQLLANFTSQLGHIGELFSMNGDKNKFGEYEISKSYFGQPLYDTAPNVDQLYVDTSTHDLKLAEMIESTDIFEPRRNKFLDHLLGRFAESFTDYALLSYKVSGKKAAWELIEDKLQFLKKYPLLSAARGKGMNYKAPCNSWHVENVSGLELRASLLLGMAEKLPEELVFSANFSIVESAGIYGFEIRHADSTLLLKNVQDYDSEATAKAALEAVIVNGAGTDNYKMVTDSPGQFLIRIYCDEKPLAESDVLYTNLSDLYADIGRMTETLLTEFHQNPESNRRNLACPVDRYIATSNHQFNATPEPSSISFDYDVYDKPLDDATKVRLFGGTITRQSNTALSGEELAAFTQKYLWEILTLMIKPGQYVFRNDGTDYRFYLCDRYGNDETVGVSDAADFNDSIEDELQYLTGLSGQTIELSAPTQSSTVQSTTFSSVTVADDLVSLIPNDPLDPDLAVLPPSELQVNFRNVFSAAGADTEERYVDLNADYDDLKKYLVPGDQIAFYEADLITRIAGYTILSMADAIAGTTTRVWVQETIPDTDYSTVYITYEKSFPVIKIESGEVFFKGLQDQAALTAYIEFIKGKFFQQEGIHLIEHSLLRPRYCSNLLESNGDAGTLELTFRYPIVAVEEIPTADPDAEEANIRITISGRLPNALQDAHLLLTGPPFDSDAFVIDQMLYLNADNETRLDVLLKNTDAGDLLPGQAVERWAVFNYEIAIANLLPEDHCLTIDGATVTDEEILDYLITFLQDPGSVPYALPANIPEVRIGGGDQVANNRLFLIDEVQKTGVASYRICLASDPLLPIHLDQDCENCQFTDVYSCIATVILPYWPGRFQNREVRKFIEKTLRTEAPAHLFLNICWVSCEHMHAFEYAYRSWLLAWSKKEPIPMEVHEGLSLLINALTQARTVYPKGTLHSCDDDDTFEGAVILNNSALGMF